MCLYSCIRYPAGEISWYTLYCQLWPDWPYHIIPHYLISSTILGKSSLLNARRRVLLEKLTGFQLLNKFPRISRNPKFHYRTEKRPPPVSILGQPNPVHISTSHLLEIHPNIVHPSMPRSPQWSLSLPFPHQDPTQPLSLPIRDTCPTHYQGTIKTKKLWRGRRADRSRDGRSKEYKAMILTY